LNKVDVFSSTTCELGEGPLWHPLRNSLFWLDIFGFRLYEKTFDSESVDFDNVWELSEIGSALAVDGNSVNSLFIVSNLSFSRINLDTGKISMFVSLPSHVNMRANDGGVSPNGDFWFGTMEKNPSGRNGNIYSISPEGQLIHQLAKFGIPNTFVWSADGSYLYLSDSFQQKMFTFEVGENQVICHSRKTLFIDLSSTKASPDGGALDEDGNIWNAQWGDFKVRCYSPRGELLNSVDFPVPKVSSCCFGGPQNAYLFITSAREGMNPVELEKYPLSGCVFMVKLKASLGRKLPDFFIERAV